MPDGKGWLTPREARDFFEPADGLMAPDDPEVRVIDTAVELERMQKDMRRVNEEPYRARQEADRMRAAIEEALPMLGRNYLARAVLRGALAEPEPREPFVAQTDVEREVDSFVPGTWPEGDE